MVIAYVFIRVFFIHDDCNVVRFSGKERRFNFFAFCFLLFALCYFITFRIKYINRIIEKRIIGIWVDGV
jgi:hypothetical protein